MGKPDPHPDANPTQAQWANDPACVRSNGVVGFFRNCWVGGYCVRVINITDNDQHNRPAKAAHGPSINRRGEKKMTNKLYDVKLSIGFGYTEAGSDIEGTPKCTGDINVEYFGMEYCHVVGVETAVIGVLNNLNAAGNMKCEEDLPPAEVEKQRAAMKVLQGRMEG